MNSRRIDSVFALRPEVIGVLALLATSVAQAQQVEEIIVTAQKRAQPLDEVGIAITALSADQVKQLNLRSLTDIASQTPSLAIASPLGSSGNQNFTLRGVGLNDFSEHNESPVAAYQDGVYQATIAGVNTTLFDVERVEVLRGPQGTLYGRNTTGGLVQFFSKQPSADAQGFIDVGVGRSNERRIEAAVGGPINDVLQYRVAGLYDYRDGWGDTTVAGLDAANGSDALGGRVLLKYLPNQDTSVLFNVHAHTNHTTGPAYTALATMYASDGITQIPTPAQTVNPQCANVFGLTGPGQDCFGYRHEHDSPWLTDFNRQPLQKLDTFGSSLTLDTKLAGMSLVSITAYEQVEKHYSEDTDGGPFPAIAVTNPVDSKQWTQELRLSGDASSLHWTAGAFYFNRDIRTGSRTSLADVGFVDDEFYDRLQSTSAALFGQLEFAITSQLTLIGGARYSHEDQEFQLLSVDHTGLTPVILGITSDPIPDYNVFPFTGGVTADPTPYRDRNKDDLVTWRGEINWRLEKGMLLYGSVSKGTKSAGWNGAIDGSPLLGPSTEEAMPYAAESLLAYEVGFKHTMRGLYRLNAAAFYYDYKDFQAFTFAGLVQQIANRPASVKGAELEFLVSPTDHLDLTLGGSYLDTNVEDVTTAIVGSSPLQTVTRDRKMVLAPEYSLNAVIRYHWTVGADQEMSVQLDGRYVGEHYFDLGNNPITREAGYGVANASISWRSARWNASVWVRNLADREYRLYAIPVTGLGFTQQMYGQPRWYGVTFGYSW